MPLFDYQCEKCSEVYEVLQYKTTPVIPKCPKCGDSENQKKLLSCPKIVRVPQDGYPKNDAQLSKYLGNGQYMK